MRQRWKTGAGLSAYTRIVRAIQGKDVKAEDTPFGPIAARQDWRGFECESLTGVRGCTFRDIDLTGANFTHVRIEECRFANAVFDGAKFWDTTDVGNEFTKCSFVRTSFRAAMLGYRGSHYADCMFERSGFRRAQFIRAEFDRCRFADCDLKGVDFGGSSFEDSAFSGKLEDVWFRGRFAYQLQLEQFGTPRKNQMLRVDFSDAELWWLTFSNECDLSTVRLPRDGYHRLFDRWKQRIDTACNSIAGWPDNERGPALHFLSAHRVHAENQSWYILNEHEVIERLGPELGWKVIEVLGPPVSPK